jgi:ankyrin repeat protein
MPYFEEYSALDAPPPPKPKGKCSQWCTNIGKFFGCLHLSIHEAVLSGSEKHIDATLELIHQGKKSNRAKLNVYNKDGCTALSLAIKSRQTPMAFAILGRKVDPDVPDLSTGRTPLFYACMQGDFKLNKLLLLNGADPNFGDFDCVTPLMMAAAKNDAQTVEFMCNSRMKILDMDAQDFNGWTALHYAAFRNGHKAISVLLNNGADRDIRDANRRKPVHIARHFDRGESLAVLEDTKARLAFASGEDD